MVARARAWFVVMVSVCALLVAGAQGAGASGSPNLVQRSVSSPPSALQNGQAFSVHDIVANAGSANAAASVTWFFLSADTRVGSDVGPIGSRAVPMLKPGATSTRTVALDVPTVLKAGRYHVLACADAAKAVHESSESDDCRASASVAKVTIDDGTWPAVKPHPLTVHPATPVGHKVTKTIPAAAGGMITLQYGGAKFVLSVPKNALLSDQAITMSPLTGVVGMPFSGGLVAGVDLQPSGLRFLQPVALTITPPHAVPVARRAGFEYSNGGSDFSLYPLEAGSAVRFELLHFTGVGLGSASSADISAMENNAPAHSEAEWQQQTAILRDRGHNDPSLEKRLETAMSKGYYFHVIRPALVAALRGDTLKLGPPAVQQAIAWDRYRELQGVIDGYSAEIESFTERITARMYNLAYLACLRDHNPAMTRQMLSILHYRALQGEGGLDESKVNRCASFQLDFDSTFTIPAYSYGDADSGGDYQTFTFHVQAENVPVHWDGTSLHGSGPDRYPDFTGSGKTWDHEGDGGTGSRYCESDFTADGSTGSTFRVVHATFNLNFFDPTAPPATRNDLGLRITLDPGEPKDIWNYTTNDPTCLVPQGIVHNVLWWVDWSVMHAAEQGRDGSWTITGWTPGEPGSGLVGTKEYSVEQPGNDGSVIDEHTVLAFRHTPGA